MAEFVSGDKVRVKLPHGYSKRGVYGISVLYATSPEARFEGAVGVVTEVNPRGPYSNAQYLVDFRGQDNARLALPWQAHWFREEWIELVDRPAQPTDRRASAEDSAPVAAGTGPGQSETPAN
jgi:hypothetical protein